MTTVTHEGNNTRIGLDWAAIRSQLIAAGVPVLRLLPASVPQLSTGRSVCAMWCAQRVWMSYPQPTPDEAAFAALLFWLFDKDSER